MGGNVHVKSGSVKTVLPATTATVTGGAIYKDAPKSAIDAAVVGTGAVAATVVIDCSNGALDAAGAIIWNTTPLGTITLSGTTSAADGFTTDAPWKYIRGRVTAISGTGATVTAQMGV